ncbi:E3 ubiquitin-protein ligase rnf8 [Cajanus cajan]|uniref:RING-type domain-containing protein n=1 Tax=Cajanus cajan TaxID=3821 RepID=A0A151T6M0_CAJCA|nr:E3 ubiquitin-protein ligase rnf8 [Cajanus cajan]KYP62708.1 hypothetical protein KK1_017256 [Cajanus cajan]
MSQLGAELQEPQREPRTILGLLSEQMEGGTRRRRTLKERFGFMGMGCCGATWGFRSHHDALSQTEREQQQERDPECVSPGMNLAAALAAERQLRGPQEEAVRAPWRVSLMRLLEEAEAEAETEQEQEKEKGGVAGNDSVCCVCMGRKKGAAFIPCGHTFCRVCSRELWLNRGSCPLCNRSILEILHIF